MAEIDSNEQLSENSKLEGDASTEDTIDKENNQYFQSAKYSLLAGALILLIVIATIGFGYYYSSQVETQSLNIGELDSQISVLDTQITFEEQKSEKKKQELKKLKTELTSTTSRLLWSEILDELNRVVSGVVNKSEGRVVYNFNSYSLTNNGSVSINGFTNSYSAIADLIDALEASPKFKEISFNSSSKSMTEDGQERATLSLSFKLEDSEKQSITVNPATPIANSDMEIATEDTPTETKALSEQTPTIN